MAKRAFDARLWPNFARGASAPPCAQPCDGADWRFRQTSATEHERQGPECMPNGLIKTGWLKQPETDWIETGWLK